VPGPPSDVPANELFLRLLDRPRPGEEVPFPGLDLPGARGKLRIQVLHSHQHTRARLIAQNAVKKQAARYGLPPLTELDMQGAAVKGAVSDLAACEVLAMACTGINPISGSDTESANVRYPVIFADGEAVSKTLSADEVAYLFAAYTIVQNKFGPNEAICLPEDVNAWVRRLVEGAEDYPFLRLSSPQWAELLTALASKLYTLNGILESQWESLPESLRSELQTYLLGTGSAGEPASHSSAEGVDLPGPGQELSMEQAMRLANLKLKPQQDE
jgi:hypothetical protein